MCLTFHWFLRHLHPIKILHYLHIKTSLSIGFSAISTKNPSCLGVPYGPSVPPLYTLLYISSNHAERLRCTHLLFLRKLSIEYQTIPSIKNLESMWKNKFCFEPIGPEMLKEMSQWNSVMVHSTVRLYRSLLSKAELLQKEECAAAVLGYDSSHHHASSLTGPSSSSARPDHQPSSVAGTSTSSAKLDENQVRPMPDHQPSSAAGTSTSSAKLDESQANDQERLILDHEPSSATGAAKKQLIPDLNEVYVPIDLNEKPVASEEER